MIDIFNIEATDKEEDQFDLEVDSCQSTQDSPQGQSTGMSQSNRYSDSNENTNLNGYQEEMNLIEEQIQKEINSNDFSHLDKKQRYKMIRKIKNKYSSRKSRLKKMLDKNNLENVNQDLKKQVAGLKIQVQNLGKENQILLETIYNLHQVIEQGNINKAQETCKKYRIEKQGNSFVFRKSFILLITLFLFVAINLNTDTSSTNSIKIAGFDFKHLQTTQGTFIIQDIAIERPPLLKKFTRINKKVFMNKLLEKRKKNRQEIHYQFNYQKFILIYQ